LFTALSNSSLLVHGKIAKYVIFQGHTLVNHLLVQIVIRAVQESCEKEMAGRELICKTAGIGKLPMSKDLERLGL